MAQTFTDPKLLVESFKTDIYNRIIKAHNESAFYMAHRIDLSYENRGFLQPRSKRGEPVPLIPTSRIARMNRKSYPGGGSEQRKGKKGLTQQQAQYIYSSPTLEDTGAMRAGTGTDHEFNKMQSYKSFVGTDKEYIATSEDGGTYKGHDVPARPIQIIYDFELPGLDNSYLKGFR